MKKTYITNMPTDIGAFLKASCCFADLGINITRVSYNKAIDSHTLFIDVDGTPEQLEKADEALGKIGYLNNTRQDNRIVLVEFRVKNEPGGAIGVLRLVNDFRFNISFISAQDNHAEYQLLKLGLYVNDPQKISEFLACAGKLCEVCVIEYDHSERYFDNSIFYNSFLLGITHNIELTKEQKDKLLVHTNLAMQMLDERGTFPHRTFDSIGRFAELLHDGKAEAFEPRITRHTVAQNTVITLIEPPCGSNTAMIRSCGKTLFIDTGHACYQQEMLQILRRELPDFDTMEKVALLTHSDLDHCGLLPLFDRVLVSRKTAACLTAEYEGQKTIREQIPLHEPYINICKILTGYTPPEPGKLDILWGSMDQLDVPLKQIGFFDFGELHFEVYEGQGGHVPGETILIDYTNHIAFTGDVYINLIDQTPRQAMFNQYAPILMTSVDSDPKLCAKTRQAVLQRLGVGKWQIFGGHGYKIDYEISRGGK